MQQSGCLPTLLSVLAAVSAIAYAVVSLIA